MSQVLIEGGTVENVFFKNRFRFKVNTETLGATKVLVPTDNIIQFLDNGAAVRTVTLPAEADSEGLMFMVANSGGGANAITVEDDGSNTILSLLENEMGLAICDGTTWIGFLGGAT